MNFVRQYELDRTADANNEDPDQTAHAHSLIKFFHVLQ